MDRKKKVIISLVVVVMIILFGVGYYKEFIKVQNVFDQMYYTRVRDSYDWFGGNRGTLFDNMKQLENTIKDEELLDTKIGFFGEEYKQEYLDENHSISITFYREEREVHFYYRIIFPEESEKIDMQYTYHLNSRNLVKEPLIIKKWQIGDNYEPITNETEINDFLSRHNLTVKDLDKLQEWFLYDKILVDFFDANEGSTRFTIDDMGKVKS